MKIQESLKVEQETIGSFDEIASSIRMEDLGFALTAVSKNLYSNPIGSFVRELVSNAVDANIGSNNKVEVKIYKEGEEWYFSVQDFGTGMTREHFETVYMTWFNSDKRESNDAIGGWGLGSKTPLAYREDYEIDTVANGIENCYVVVKQVPVPTATLLASRETTKPSGTVVRFPIKEDDLYKIHNECSNQLVYFNNVIVINEYKYYDNEFNIIEADNFLFRPDKTPYANDMHIVIGQVPYPIDFNIIKRPNISIPIAVKFPIGSLPVTLSRESINYNHESLDVIGIINNRIDEIIQDLEQRLREQRTYTDLMSYLKIFESENIKYLELGGYNLYIGNNIKYKPKYIIDDKYEISVKKVGLDSLVDELYNKHKISNFKIVDDYFYGGILRLIYGSSDYVLKTTESTHWSNKYYNNKKIITKKKVNKKLLLSIGSSLGMVEETKIIKNGRARTMHSLGKYTRPLYYLCKEIDKLINNFQKYEYVPQDYIDREKAAQKEAEDARKGKITVYSLYGNMQNISVEELYNNYDYVFYMNRKDYYKEVAHYDALFKTLPKYYKKKFKFILITPTSIKVIKKLDKFKPVSVIWRYAKLRNHFNRIRLSEEVKKLGLINIDLLPVSEYYSYINERLTKEYYLKLNLTTAINCYEYTTDGKEEQSVYINLGSHFEEELTKLKNNKVYLFEDKIKELEKVKEYLKIAIVLYQNNKALLPYFVNQSKLTKIERFKNY